MSDFQAQLNDIGTVLRVQIVDEDGTPIDISAATVKEILLLKPDKRTSLLKTATFTTDGTDGMMEYVTVDGDLDKLRVWQIQGRVTTPLGKWSSKKGTFCVLPNIPDPV